MITDWTLLSLSVVAVWTVAAVVHALWAAADSAHEPAPPEVPDPHHH